MSSPYEEILNGGAVLRSPPDARHELLCARLHGLVAAGLGNFSGARLLPPRTRVQLDWKNSVCPDLALVTAATGKLWLAAEIIGRDDHRWDTVTKKEIYETLALPRLWMVDPRYDNVEIYHGSPHGLKLHGSLAGRGQLTETLLPDFGPTIEELFKTII
ncbi:MAG: putative restriction endonuclease [Verrucomicrobiota bacterium]